ncbi:MAG: phage major capsid domain-containing protein, partial [Candidatus Fonsibacter sp.]
MNLNRVDIVVYWKDTFGNIHPFELHPGCSANVKLMFRRKDLTRITENMISLNTIYTMSETFENTIVKDDRLGCITPQVKSQVFQGGQNITCQPYKAISETTANHFYNVTAPSLETIIIREVLWRSTVT